MLDTLLHYLPWQRAAKVFFVFFTFFLEAISLVNINTKERYTNGLDLTQINCPTTAPQSLDGPWMVRCLSGAVRLDDDGGG
jgi:hypothetical protein